MGGEVVERVRFNQDRCKGCGLCVSVCPAGIIFLADGFNRHGYHPATVTEQDRCIGCTLCAVMCPDLVIEVFRPARGRGTSGKPSVAGPAASADDGRTAAAAARKGGAADV